ncbi:MAG: hypothetical protein AMS25_12065 [Gemmatimonas sp. SM23_52]|nr:MAG: hypothetical protein AMS25_12065 [Gemmatimonas sp. SM23_52]
MHWDPISIEEFGVTQCGDLTSVQDGYWDVYYKLDQPHIEDEDYVTVYYVTRNKNTGAVDAYVKWTDQDTIKNDTVGFELEAAFDLIGIHCQIHDDPDPLPYYQGVEGWAQIWRRIPEPVIESIVLEGEDDVRITFENNSFTGPPDSTEVQRRTRPEGDWETVGVAGEDAEEYLDVDVDLAYGYDYRLRHLSPHMAMDYADVGLPPRPNSKWSNVDSLLVLSAPTSLSCDDNLEPEVKCEWTNGDNGVAIEVKRDGVIVETLDAGITEWIDTDVSWDDTLVYRVRHSGEGKFSAWSDPDTIAVEKTAPSNLYCYQSFAPGETEVHCFWDPGEGSDSTEVTRNVNNTRWWFPQDTLPPGQAYYIDENVQTGNTYYYKVRHRRGATVTAWSNIDSVTVN